MKLSTVMAGMTAALALALATAGPAAAQTTTRCGGEFTAEETCSFVYGGGSVGVGLALGLDPLGFGVVRLEAELPAATARVKGTSRRARKRRAAMRRQTVRRLILTCEAVGVYGVCGAGQSSDEPIAPIGTVMHCTVVGRTTQAGRYGCSSTTDESDGYSGHVSGGGGGGGGGYR